mmetsp:Transcript_14917/g.30926  ORF Transcript_14917/g.30926 Transcript_14917/m.30926 type:complete len:131 (+) Transcript_14917:159-551(+)
MMLLRSVALMAALVGCADAFVSPAGNTISRDTSLNVETIRKKEFVAAMAEELGCTKTDAEATLMATLTMISDTLADGNKVNFAGFGTFEPRYRKARKGRNPKTGEEIDIAASVGAGFSAAKALKEKLNDK